MKRIYLLGLLLLTSLNVFGQIEIEPNNYFNEVNVLEWDDLFVSVQGAIDPEDDLDYYQVEVSQAGVFVINIFDVAPEVDMYVTLYDAMQNEIDEEDGEDGEAINMNTLVCEAGTYYFRLKDYGDNQSSPNLYNFTIAFDITDVYECNNQFTTAKTIPIGDTIQAKLRTVSDIDFYKIEVPQTGVIVADVFNVPADIDIELTLYDSGQNEIEFENEGFGEPVNLTELVCEAGTYYIKLEDDTGFGNYGSSDDFYSLSVALDIADVYECNNNFAEAISLNTCETIQAAINDEGDEDYYFFDANSGESITIELTNVAENILPKIRIYDATQVQIESESAGAGLGLTIDFLPPSTGQFYVKIESVNGNNANSQLYNLILRDASCVATGFNSLLDENNIKLYNNPTTQTIVIEAKEEALTNTQASIYNTAGQVLAVYTDIRENNQIDISSFPNGILIVQLQHNQEIYVKKVFKR